jgi:hypothetical protein
MATITPTTTSLQPAGAITHAVWTPLANGDVGAAVYAWPGADRSFAVTGTFGTGGTLVWQGSNDLTSPTNWFTLSDPQGTALSLTSSKFKQIEEYALWMRPSVTAGDGTTALTVNFLASR